MKRNIFELHTTDDDELRALRRFVGGLSRHIIEQAVTASNLPGEDATDLSSEDTDTARVDRLFDGIYDAVKEAHDATEWWRSTNNKAVRFEFVESASERGLVHRVTLVDGERVACTCKGFSFRGGCKHLS